MMLRRMVGLLFIEVSAFHTFAWAEEVLSDTDSSRATVAPPNWSGTSARTRPRTSTTCALR